MLEGVNVALAVSGSIAAVKTVELAHELRREGATVRAVLTGAATGIVHPWAVEFATENDVITEITGRVEHVELCGREGWADVLLVAPATANTVGKMAAAIDDTPVTTTATTALGADVPVVVAPAMHEPMYDHPGVLASIERLEEWGVTFVDPRIEEGKAKIAAEADIVTETARRATPSPLEGRTVVVTSGATSERIDPIRVLTNRSSGKTGRAVARACHVGGPDVGYAAVRRVESAAEMLDAVSAAVEEHDADALVSAAAISDYTVEASEEKIKSGEQRTLELVPTPKLIDSVRDAHPDLSIVGFKAETEGGEEALVERARETLDRAGLAFVVGNHAGVMGGEETRTVLVRADSTTEFEGSKSDLGRLVAEELAGELAS
jgi:phosphopantothenoylcysteine decarboxylase/phosphopantothenate--cysteine ligase